MIVDDIFRRQLAGMHLQWFAAEDEGRTEEPTEHKIRKAREEGKVAKSQDLSGTVVLLACVAGMAILATFMFKTFGEMLRFYLSQATSIDPTHSEVLVPSFLGYFIKLALPICLIGFLAAVAGNLIQVGFLFSTKPLKPDFKRIMPKFGDYFKRNFASAEALYKLAKSSLMVAIIVGITWANVTANFDKLMELPMRTFLEGTALIGSISYSILMQCGIVMLAMAFFDYWFQRRQFRDSLKMTKQEIKEERKSYDGDPLIKSRLRQRMREILTQNMIRNVPKADVVVTNPTHYAVALQYERDSMSAPQVIAKGQDLVAQRIKEVAKENNVPIIENRPLARALYAEVEIGDAIPEKFYEAVVIVLKQVYRMKKKEQEAVS